MADLAVVNASPVILLAKAGRIELLRLAAQAVVVPRAVVDEVRAHRDDVGSRALDVTRWLTVVEREPVPTAVTAANLGPGESAVLAFAGSRSGAIAVLDDLAGRRLAASLGIPVCGTLGLVLTAKQRGVIPAARPVLLELVAAGMYLSPSVIQRALARVGE